MTDDHDPPLHPRDAARHDRLRDALRANLKRRKMQSRGRALVPDGTADDPDADAPDHAQDISLRHIEPDDGL